MEFLLKHVFLSKFENSFPKMSKTYRNDPLNNDDSDPETQTYEFNRADVIKVIIYVSKVLPNRHVLVTTNSPFPLLFST
jgi:hypothetical protein